MKNRPGAIKAFCGKGEPVEGVALADDILVEDQMTATADPQLNLLLQQLGRMYESLRAMQRGIGQRDPQLFKVMAEGPLDEIRQLQHSIDEYTGVAELRVVSLEIVEERPFDEIP